MASFDPLSILIFLGTVQALLLGVGLLTVRRKGNLQANRYLGLLFLSFSLSLTYALLLRSNLYLEFPHMLNVSTPQLFLFGPLFYLYVRSVTSKQVNFDFRTALHFLPFILVTAYFVPFYLLSGAEKISIVQRMEGGEVPAEGYVIGALQMTHFFCYLIVVWIRLRRHRQDIKSEFSSLEKVSLRWLQFVVLGFLLIYGVMLIAFGAMLVGLNVYVPSQYIVAVLAATAIYGMGYMAFRQPLIFHGENQPRLSAKYEGSTLTPDRGDEYLYRLRQTMENERPFLDPDLTVQKLANACTIPSYHLSQLLNERLGNTFYDFVNAHRIEEAKRLLCDPSKRHFSIFAIAQESGFNSKSVFNTAFKKLTGVPPSQFRNQSSLKT